METLAIQKPKKTNIPAKNKENQVVHYNQLNDVQLSLLRMFSRPMSVEQSLKLKRAIVSFLSEELDKEVERVVAEKGYTQADFDKLRKQHQRMPRK